jgi:hypothetical protein
MHDLANSTVTVVAGAVPAAAPAAARGAPLPAAAASSMVDPAGAPAGGTFEARIGTPEVSLRPLPLPPRQFLLAPCVWSGRVGGGRQAGALRAARKAVRRRTAPAARCVGSARAQAQPALPRLAFALRQVRTRASS